jgi:hypothetical protein
MSVLRRAALVCTLCAPITLLACDETPYSPPGPELRPQFSIEEVDLQPVADPSAGLEAFMSALNQQLAAGGANYVVQEAGMLLAETADPNRATIVIANDRQKRLGRRFVKDDPRRGTVGAMVRQASFLPFTSAPTGPGTFVNAKPSIDASFATWSGVKCARLPILNNVLPPLVFPSAILALGGFVNNPLFSDVNTVGFLPGFIFDIVLGPGASQQVLGVTFTFSFIDASGNLTDIDNDGNDDVAFAEIWYNGAFRWTNTGTGPNVDIETVTLHENGHALGLGHFGKIHFNTSNGKLHASPRAVMNAVVLGTLRNPRGTDDGGFCGTWANWD